MNKIRNLQKSKTLLSELANEACKKMIIIHGYCSAIFDGRIKSYLPEGDRLLIVKKDETLILHGAKGLKPLNWQISGAGKINYLFDDENFIVKTFRPKSNESLEIIFSNIYQVTIFDAHDSASLSVYGSESDLTNYLFSHPEIIEEDFQPTTKEYNTPYGLVDIRGVDKKGNIIIIEVKKRAATPADAQQLKRYIDYFQGIEHIKIKGILVAESFSEKVMNILDANNFEAIAIPWQIIFPPMANEKPKTTLDTFLEKQNKFNNIKK